MFQYLQKFVPLVPVQTADMLFDNHNNIEAVMYRASVYKKLSVENHQILGYLHQFLN